MKSLKFKMTAAALILGLGSAFATLKPATTDHKWARNPSTNTYIDITGQSQPADYNCDLSTAVCTATYPEGQNPNLDASNPVSQEQGLFN